MTDRSNTLPEAAHQPHPQMLDMLVCPHTKTRLTLSADRSELISRAARLAFPIRSGVPLLSIEESRPLTDAEYTALQ
jgi:hypothetical protein